MQPPVTTGEPVLTIRGRGTHYFGGRVTCPLAGIGTRAGEASNRIVLDDDDTVVTLDRIAGRITVANTRSYASKTRVFDLVMIATGEPAARFLICVKINKAGTKYSTEVYCHLRERTRLARIEYEPFDVVVDGRVLVERAQLADVAEHPTLSASLAQALTAERDHLRGVQQDPREPGYRVVDMSVGIGALGLSWRLVRAELVSLAGSNAELIARGSLVELLRDGTWELGITALTTRFLPEVLQRDLFVYGLEDIAILAAAREGRFRAGQRLAFRFQPDGTGSIVLDDATSPLPNALDVARAYVEFHPFGAMIARAIEARRR
jgi:hypothetical protein